MRSPHRPTTLPATHTPADHSTTQRPPHEQQDTHTEHPKLMNATTTTQTGKPTEIEPNRIDRTEPPATQTGGSPTAATDGELDIPARLPTPETTVYRDAETVIRLLQTQTMDDELAVRVYRVADGVSTGGAAIATDAGRPDHPGLDALPTETRKRVDRVVETAAERFGLQPAQTAGEYGQFRTRWPDRGFDDIIEFAVTLR